MACYRDSFTSYRGVNEFKKGYQDDIDTAYVHELSEYSDTFQTDEDMIEDKATVSWSVSKPGFNVFLHIIPVQISKPSAPNTCYLKVPGLGQKRNDCLNYSILAVISFGTYTVIPWFFPRFRRTVEVTFLNAVEYHFRLPLDVKHCFKMSSLQFHFQLGKQSEITGG
jgi:hypothetical protein